MSLVIYQKYAELRKKKRHWQINLSEQESKAIQHKCVITMDMILQYIHKNHDIDDEEDEIKIEEYKFKDFIDHIKDQIPEDYMLIDFMWYIQSNLPRDN